MITRIRHIQVSALVDNDSAGTSEVAGGWSAGAAKIRNFRTEVGLPEDNIRRLAVSNSGGARPAQHAIVLRICHPEPAAGRIHGHIYDKVQASGRDAAGIGGDG